ncbi:hypothetical protein SUGI_0180090 [Cryptomeria japonica]|nr:hypothetical protein SUGI_0180090 [Cryptomeria japonica]
MAAFISVASVLIFGVSLSEEAGGLSLNFYDRSCPGVYSAVDKVVRTHVMNAPSIAAPLLRMHFHDCFVRGCDGSVLLNSIKSQKAEKVAFPNLSLRGFEIIDEAKAVVEKLCPGVVSCADILALVARDAVHKVGGPSWNVPTGRRDGKLSRDTDALTNLPPANGNFSTLKSIFANVGLSVKDLVVLSGGHTIGTAHCSSINTRLYNFSGKGDMDPALDKTYAAQLKIKCKPGDTTNRVEMDPGSFKTFDNNYFSTLEKRRGLFQSDAALLTDNEATSYLKAELQSSTFSSDFGVSMEKMGKISVLTGTAGEIRRKCGFTN